MARKLGRARKHSPVEMEAAYVHAMWKETDLDDTEEVQTLFFVAKDIVKGTRAIDDWALDWHGMKWVKASTTQTAGWEIAHVASKNNREQRDKPIGLPCVTGCTGEICKGANGEWVKGPICPAHIGWRVKQLQARDACVPCEELDCAVFATVKVIEKVPSGATLVHSDVASAAKKAKSFVLVVTEAQEASGIFYDGSQPFTFQGRCALKVWEVGRGQGSKGSDVAGSKNSQGCCNSRLRVPWQVVPPSAARCVVRGGRKGLRAARVW